MDNFGDYLNYLRKKKGMTQAELADKLGVTNKAVSKWETGEAMPETSLLVPLSKIFGVTVDELLNGGKDSAAPDGEPEKAEEYAENAQTEQADKSEGADDGKGAEGKEEFFSNLKEFLFKSGRIDDEDEDEELSEGHVFSRGCDGANAKTSDKVCGLVCTFVFFAGLATFLTLGAVKNLWHPCWVIVPVSAFLCGIIGIIFDLCNRERREKRLARGENPYVGAVCGFVMLSCLSAYLCVGAFASLWHPYWLILVGGVAFCAIAGCIGALLTHKKK